MMISPSVVLGIECLTCLFLQYTHSWPSPPAWNVLSLDGTLYLAHTHSQNDGPWFRPTGEWIPKLPVHFHHCQLQPEKTEMHIAYIQSYSCDARQRNTVHKENIISEDRCYRCGRCNQEPAIALKLVPGWRWKTEHVLVFQKNRRTSLMFIC